jgi:DNA-binding response OmpR family regulator
MTLLPANTSHANRVLVVEDEQHLADGLRFNLEAEGYDVNTVADGETALRMLFDAEQSVSEIGVTNGASQFDAVVLDVMLPGMDGFAVAAELRRRNDFVPVLMLTARGRPEDVLRGFEAGADDYLPKPFELKILIARLGALVRRRAWVRRDDAANTAEQTENAERRGAARPSHAASPDDVYTFNGKTFDFNSLEIRTASRVVRLTLMEAELLRYLLRHAGQVVSRKQMLADVWSLHEDTDTRAIDNFIVRLRRHIEAEPARPRHLLTVRGVGYRFVLN